jgi:soluble lytic murein transglycosylase-like protein
MGSSGVTQIIQRIQNIQARFGPASVENANFSKLLESELQTKTGKFGGVVNSTTGKKSGAPGQLTSPGANISSLISASANKYGLDPKLVSAVAQTESGYRADAVSDSGAVGVMQLMPETAAELGVNNVYDPAQNIDGGAKYLKQMMTTFHGDVSKALAAYNAGPQAVKNYNGVPPYAETQNYVDKVLDLYQ